MIEWSRIKYFKPSEFSHPDLLRADMIEKLDALRDLVGFPLHITSSYRDPQHNKEVGGVQDSAHVPSPDDGLYSGVDIATAGLSGSQLFTLTVRAFRLGFCRLGFYKHHIHIDLENRLPQNVIWVGDD